MIREDQKLPSGEPGPWEIRDCVIKGNLYSVLDICRLHEPLVDCRPMFLSRLNYIVCIGTELESVIYNMHPAESEPESTMA